MKPWLRHPLISLRLHFIGLRIDDDRFAIDTATETVAKLHKKVYDKTLQPEIDRLSAEIIRRRKRIRRNLDEYTQLSHKLDG